jgi:hypothetical protein
MAPVCSPRWQQTSWVPHNRRIRRYHPNIYGERKINFIVRKWTQAWHEHQNIKICSLRWFRNKKNKRGICLQQEDKLYFPDFTVQFSSTSSLFWGDLGGPSPRSSSTKLRCCLVDQFSSTCLFARFQVLILGKGISRAWAFVALSLSCDVTEV